MLSYAAPREGDYSVECGEEQFGSVVGEYPVAVTQERGSYLVWDVYLEIGCVVLEMFGEGRGEYGRFNPYAVNRSYPRAQPLRQGECYVDMRDEFLEEMVEEEDSDVCSENFDACRVLLDREFCQQGLLTGVFSDECVRKVRVDRDGVWVWVRGGDERLATNIEVHRGSAFGLARSVYEECESFASSGELSGVVLDDCIRSPSVSLSFETSEFLASKLYGSAWVEFSFS